MMSVVYWPFHSNRGELYLNNNGILLTQLYSCEKLEVLYKYFFQLESKLRIAVSILDEDIKQEKFKPLLAMKGPNNWEGKDGKLTLDIHIFSRLR